jgi:hypothetical protein
MQRKRISFCELILLLRLLTEGGIMKRYFIRFLMLLLTVTTILLPCQAYAQQIPVNDNKNEVRPPVPGAKMTKEYVRMVGRVAYFWGWPMINMYNRNWVMSQAPEPGLNGGILPVAPLGQLSMLQDYLTPDQKAVACPNQDVVYGIGFMRLDTEPVVVQIPDFEGRFWIYAIYDMRTNEFSSLGKQYGTKPGFYMIVGPDWKGDTPKGITGVLRSNTNMACVVPRIFMDDTKEDRKAIKPYLSKILSYPLSKFDGSFKTKDWSKLPSFPMPPQKGNEETQWVVPDLFFDTLPLVMKDLKPLPGEESFYAMINSVLEAAKNDPQIKATLKETAESAEKELIKPLMMWENNGIPAGNNWNSPANNAEFGLDYLGRTATAKSNIFENKRNESCYFYTDNDKQGVLLDGKKSYTITFPKDQLPPVNGFWSLTLYNEYHFFNPNKLNRYSLGTKNKTLKFNKDGSLTLYAGSKSPGKDKESNWLPAPENHFCLYLRAYWAKESLMNGKWTPPAVQTVE